MKLYDKLENLEIGDVFRWQKSPWYIVIGKNKDSLTIHTDIANRRYWRTFDHDIGCTSGDNKLMLWTDIKSDDS